MTEWAEDQPLEGECVLWCLHDAEKYHFFRTPTKLIFVRPDGTDGEATWLIACDPCFKRAGRDPKKLEIRGDAIWQGNAPIIKALRPGD